MPTLTIFENKISDISIPKEFFEGRRHLTESEIQILKSNFNKNIDDTWQNVLVSSAKGEFDANLIQNCTIHGFLIVSRLVPAKLQFHDLVLETGLYYSNVENVVLSNDVVLHNVHYLSNYRIGERSILFNIQEMSCTNHSKFGNGILKEGEDEKVRVWIGVGNENDGRKILPFESQIPADAFIWSRYREDKLLQQRFFELTEKGNSKKLDTFGIIEHDVVIKNSSTIKDAKICAHSYIKGAWKLKNITVLSSEDEPTQIGEGVELVNGILGFGSKVFYQAVAVRFVIGRNCQLKYGARLLNSVLGDNSNVSCCEVLNSLIFPFHEQHHNSSFLIASTLGGQTNIASGATIGSNHNSRSPDGEMIAGRGFWPGLCSDFKHNSKFASFVLVSKGSYQYELNIPYPFSLVASSSDFKCVTIIPAYWFLYNMYAIARNKSKFLKRDKRVVKIQHIETDPLAPDSMQEVIEAIKRIIDLTRIYLIEKNYEKIPASSSIEEQLKITKDFLHQNPDENFSLCDKECQKKYGAQIHKPVRAYKTYRKILKYFACCTLLDYCKEKNTTINRDEIKFIVKQIPLYTKWVNVGGQIIPEEKLNELFELIKTKQIDSWESVHAFYDECQKNYLLYKAHYAIYVLEELYSQKVRDFSEDIFNDIISDVTFVSNEMLDQARSSRQKDYTDYFRKITFRNDKEFEEVIGCFTDNEFLGEFEKNTKSINEQLKNLFKM